MIDEDKGRREAQDRTHSKGQAKQRPLLFTASGNAIYERETEGYSDSHQRNSPQFTWKRIKRWFKRRDSAFWQAAFTGLTVAGLIGYTWYTRQQWITLNKSVTDSATQFEKTLSQMRAQTGIQQNTLNQTIVATRTDQRAWLAIMGIGPAVVDPKASVPVQVTVMYFNSGRTPARNIKHEVTGFIVGNPIYKLPEPLVYKTTGTPGDIFPFATGTAIWGALPKMKNLDAFVNQNAVLYVVGQVSYSDYFGQTHRTEFCGFMRRNDKVASVCPMHHYSD